MATLSPKVLRIWLALAVATCVGVIGPASAEVEQNGSILLPTGAVAARIVFVAGGCEEDRLRGIFAAHFDVRGYARVSVRMISADLGSGQIIVRLWSTCDLPSSVSRADGYVDDCVAPCTLVIGTARYLEVTSSGSTCVRFRLDMVRA